MGTRPVFRFATLVLVAGGLTYCGTSQNDPPADPIPVDSGIDTSISEDAGPASPDADAGSADATTERMSEEEWQRVTAPIAGPHDIDAVPRWGCPTSPAGPDSLLIPPVYCAWRSNPNAPMGQVKDCDVQPYCRGHADCSALPFGRCRGELEAKCVYPSAPPSPCSSDFECKALPLGGCARPVEPNTVFCYPTGRCERQQAQCGYLREWCDSDADCTTAPLGSCRKDILYAHCESHGCVVDGDCGAGQRCACSRPIKVCVPADCMTDGDCPSGEQCRLESACFNIALGYHCSTPLDTCRAPEDCIGSYCDFDGRWQCSPQPCID